MSLSKNIPTIKLAYDLYRASAGSVSKEPIVFIHGLFGSKINNRTVSKVFARDLARDVFCVDLRNHGDSPHDETHNYPALAADVENFIAEQGLQQSILIGHSMGAKTAMAVALRSPELVKAMICVDNSPADGKLSSAFPRYVEGLKQVEAAHVKTSKQAYKILAEYEKSLTIQHFLLSNLKKQHHGNYHFRVPLDILGASLNNMADFPFRADESRYDGPSLFIRGLRSKYASEDTFKAMKSFFPNCEIRDIDSGHWVISEKPQEFIAAVESFVGKL
ncbi:hypothetical protein DV495_002501 [Geotrichum candidum]|nr:hypothetical protein DV454_003644 [Geotrichum candidum]KAF5129217.1 hypothetical protein DV495_002501 [Geotrichum candidum]